MPIKVLLVDDQQLLREGIKSLLSISDKVQVVGEASDGTQVQGKIEQTHPDIILLDVSMPKMNGIEVLQQLQQLQINVPAIILTTFDDHEYIVEGLKAGAKGYLLKDVSLDKLIESIEHVVAGGQLHQPVLTESLISRLGQSADKSDDKNSESLTARELQVLGLMANGCSNKEIADVLYKSEGTIKNHVSNILAKLGVRDRTRAVLLAMEKGLLSH
ncbi:response regulator [Neptunicella marina]|uniref:Response regulator transcription factor n=1 Tax=Neptunicella marina TaxID=2125989 RepID=A0A8J6M149_9ALTE|nr:response regulator transcription factor [Neptunicella marina]MBC3765278.1 response regulator transcription factor [Neptunicella marina]